MASTRTEIRLPHNNESREWEVPSFRYIHLIRGGRFLLAIIKGAYEVWDLQEPTTPKLALRHFVGHFERAYNTYTNSPTSNKLQYIWSRRESVPATYVQS
jgi:hypothetical protein